MSVTRGVRAPRFYRRRVTRADTRTEAAAALVRNATPCPTCQHSTWTKQHRAHTRFGDRDGR